jgi:hypothetical protein
MLSRKYKKIKESDNCINDATTINIVNNQTIGLVILHIEVH